MRVGDAGDPAASPVEKSEAAALTLLMLQPLMPMEARRRRVFGDGRQVVADVAAFKKDAAAGVATLDGAVGVVPLVDPADGEGGVLENVDRIDKTAFAEPPEQGECAVENALIAAADHDHP